MDVQRGDRDQRQQQAWKAQHFLCHDKADDTQPGPQRRREEDVIVSHLVAGKHTAQVLLRAVVAESQQLVEPQIRAHEINCEDGEEDTVEVQPDFELIAFDFVSNPSTHGAFMAPVNESVQHQTPENNIERILNSIMRG